MATRKKVPETVIKPPLMPPEGFKFMSAMGVAGVANRYMIHLVPQHAPPSQTSLCWALLIREGAVLPGIYYYDQIPLLCPGCYKRIPTPKPTRASCRRSARLAAEQP